MKKALEKNTTNKKCWYFVDGEKIFGIPSEISGNVSDISGNVDNCETTDDERKSGIDISDLIK